MAGSATGFTHSSAQGKAAELKAAVLLMERGHEVAVPLSDNGVDLVVDYCWRVQVKSTVPKMRRVNPAGTNEYLLRVWAKIKPADADFYVLHSFEGGVDRWWVVPSAEFGGAAKTTITSYEGAGRGFSARLNEFEDRWDLFGEPYVTQKFVGENSETPGLVLFRG